MDPAPFAVFSADGSTYSFATPIAGDPGNHYKLCWGFQPVGLADFNVELDSLVELRGPDNAGFSMESPVEKSPELILSNTLSIIVLAG